MDTTVTRIDRHPIQVPFREIPARNLRRELPHWQYLEILEVELACGAVGYGEDMLYYGWGTVTDDDVKRARGSDGVNTAPDRHRRDVRPWDRGP